MWRLFKIWILISSSRFFIGADRLYRRSPIHRQHACTCLFAGLFQFSKSSSSTYCCAAGTGINPFEAVVSIRWQARSVRLIPDPKNGGAFF